MQVAKTNAEIVNQKRMAMRLLTMSSNAAFFVTKVYFLCRYPVAEDAQRRVETVGTAKKRRPTCPQVLLFKNTVASRAEWGLS